MGVTEEQIRLDSYVAMEESLCEKEAYDELTPEGEQEEHKSQGQKHKSIKISPEIYEEIDEDP